MNIYYISPYITEYCEGTCTTMSGIVEVPQGLEMQRIGCSDQLVWNLNFLNQCTFDTMWCNLIDQMEYIGFGETAKELESELRNCEAQLYNVFNVVKPSDTQLSTQIAMYLLETIFDVYDQCMQQWDEKYRDWDDADDALDFLLSVAYSDRFIHYLVSEDFPLRTYPNVVRYK